MASNSRFCLYTPPLSSISSYLEMVDLAEKYGIHQLETLNILDLSTPDLNFARKLRDYAQEKGVRFPCVSLGLDLVGENHVQALETAKAYVDIAAILESPFFHHTIAMNFTDPALTAKNFDLFYKRGLEATRQLYDYAQSLGIRTVYEDQGFLFNGVENFSRFLREVDRDVGVVADFGNIQFVDQQAEDFISAFHDRVVHVHVKDYKVTPGSVRSREPEEYLTKGGNYLLDTLVGEGSVHTETCFQTLQAIGYQGAVSLECSPIGPDEEAGFCHSLNTIYNYMDQYL